MIKQLLFASLIILGACKSKSKTDSGDKKDMDTAIVPKKDSTSTIIQTDTGKVDIENFGPLKLGQHYSETHENMGPPDNESKAIEWGADGLMHSDWTWKRLGLVLNMSAEKGKEIDTWSIFTITAKTPCNFKTGAGLGIGSTYADVQATYHKNIDPEATDKTQITVGSIYGGIIFSFKNDKVSKIFLGAEAE